MLRKAAMIMQFFLGQHSVTRLQKVIFHFLELLESPSTWTIVWKDNIWLILHDFVKKTKLRTESVAEKKLPWYWGNSPYNIWGPICFFVLYTKYLFYISNIHSIFHAFVFYFKCLFHILNISFIFQVFIPNFKYLFYIPKTCFMFQIIVLCFRYLS